MKPSSNAHAEIAALIFDRFQGRRDAYAIRKKLANAGGKHPFNPARMPDRSDLTLTLEDIHEHVSGAHTIGMYLFEKGGNTVQTAVFDLDDHTGSTPWEEILSKSTELVTLLKSRGLNPVHLRSRGGKGIHIWLLFDSPVNAASLRAFMAGILSSARLREGSDGGLAAGVCEIFPKQDKVAATGYGNLVALPLSGESAPIDAQGEILAQEKWLEFFQTILISRANLIPPLPETEKRSAGRPKKEMALDNHPLEACAFVKHCRSDAATLSEPLWFGLASNCGVVDGGRELFHEVSRIDVARYEVDEAENKINRAEEAKSPHRCTTLAEDGFTCPNMDQAGKCNIHGGHSPAVFALEPKARIRFIKSQPKLHITAKQEAISKIMLEDLRKSGNFYLTLGDGRHLYFHEAEKCLYDLDGIDFKAFCNSAYDINGSTSLWKFCLEDALAHCIRHGVETDTYRFSRWQDKKLYIHAGGQNVFRLNGQTEETISNGTDGVLFEDSGVEPIDLADSYTGSPVRECLVDGLNCRDSAYEDLLETYIYCLFFESLQPTKPILLMNGVKGSGKTSKVRSIKRALFGSNADVSTGFTKSEGDALAAITHNHFLIADNVDGNVPWLGNLMASIATGTEIAVRTLYKTNALSTFTPRCFLAITSRDPLSFKRDDIADRLFIINVDRHTNFVAESVLDRRVIDNRGAIWTELLDKLNRVILKINQGDMPTTSKHRLADWARLVTVIGDTLDLKEHHDGLELLAKARRDFVLEDNVIYEGIQKWVNAGKWMDESGAPRELTTGELYADITRHFYFSGPGYPIRSPRKFGVEFRNMIPELASMFHISVRDGHARKRFVTIKPIEQQKAA